ncbi:ABC transporter permease [Mucilaginibacter sp. ZT4R22]|uniref:ABC transporter permease n=1 Tax=Mucilaginibacter pankratovii TaxID=2772110 RepID=A0ABR7WVX0_9SPHI|nr:ABC transporter permease [Mucilaginibacter pankratovii]MBD1366363.1 ABC transporter permease [Mucilaginibacter pankratovii]
MIILKLIRESFLFAYDALRQNKLRTMLSLLGVTIGIFTIIAVYSAVDTLRNNLQASVNKLGNNSIYIEKWPWVGEENFPWWKYMQRPVAKLRDYEQVRRRSQTAKAISYDISIDNRTVKYGSNTVDGAQIGAVSFEHDKVINFDFKDGRYFTEIEARTGAPITLIGYDIAENLFPAGDAVGKQIKIMGRKVTVIGVFTKQGDDMLGISTDKQVLVPLNFAKNVIDVENEKYQPSIVVRGLDNLSEDEVESEIRGIMRSVRSIRPGAEDNFALNKSSVITNQLDSLFGIVNKGGFIIGLFSLLVGGFGVANIMFVSVRERTNIIGIQKSLGAKNYFILLQFLIESMILCLIGGLIGIGLVYLGTFGVKAATDLQIILDIDNIITGVSYSLTIGIIAGIIPAYGASRMDPVEAIRTN